MLQHSQSPRSVAVPAAVPVGVSVGVAPLRDNARPLLTLFAFWSFLRVGRMLCVAFQAVLPFRLPLLWLGDPDNWWPPRPGAGRLRPARRGTLPR